MKASSKKSTEKLSEDFSDDAISKMHRDCIKGKSHNSADWTEVLKHQKDSTANKKLQHPAKLQRIQCGNRKRSQKVDKNTKSQRLQLGSRKQTDRVATAESGSSHQKICIAKPISEQVEPILEHVEPISEHVEPISEKLDPIAEQIEDMAAFLRAIETNNSTAHPRSNGEYLKLAWDFVGRARSFTDNTQKPPCREAPADKPPRAGAKMLAQLCDLDSRLSNLRQKSRDEERRLASRLRELVREKSAGRDGAVQSDFVRARILLAKQFNGSK